MPPFAPDETAIFEVTPDEGMLSQDQKNKIHDRNNRTRDEVLAMRSTGIVTCSSEGKVSNLDRGAQKLFGYTNETATTMHVEELIPEEIRAFHKQWYIDFVKGREHVLSLATGNPSRIVEGVRKSGERFKCVIEVAKFYRLDGTIYCCAYILRHDVQEVIESHHASEEKPGESAKPGVISGAERVLYRLIPGSEDSGPALAAKVIMWLSLLLGAATYFLQEPIGKMLSGGDPPSQERMEDQNETVRRLREELFRERYGAPREVPDSELDRQKSE